MLVSGTLAIGGELHEGWIEVEGEAIARCEHGQPPREPDVRHEGVVAPGLVDLQVNGAAGHDAAGSADDLDAIDAAMLAHGVTTYVAVLASPDEALARRAMPELERRAADPSSPLAGVHFEGPYISRDYIGAHPPERVSDPPAHAPDWMRSPALAVVTLAPELPGATALIAELDRLGVMVSLGHSGATAWETRAAADAGAQMVTHIFNAMTPIHHRETRLPGAALTDDRLLISVLSDNVHVAAPALELVHRAAGDRVVLVSDATPGAHAEPGHYTMSGVEIVREKDGSIRTPDGRLAGSALTLDAHMRLWASLTSATLGEAIQAASERPASLIGRSARLDRGAPADVVLLDPRSAEVVRVMRHGRWLDTA
ncbi:MAG: N-acetylglucosamine-6-phosphate deacetylase [Thermoleophilaceae bacterium]